MTKVTPIASYLRQTSSAEQELYDYLMRAVQNHAPDELLQEFRQFLLEGRQAPTPELHQALITILKTPGVEEDFKFILNRCCHIISKAKPYLERRFSILFSHYEFQSQEGGSWLIKSLENLHIALSVHFGNADVSFLKQIMSRG